MSEAPKSYKDQYWADLASAAEKKAGIPDGLLNAIVTKGERSNNDQVSKDGARTVFQIIPETRELAIKKWGIDAYLSPENAANVSALLLKDGMTRYKGNVADAVADYHSGPDRKLWGPITKAYVARVTGDTQTDGKSSPPAKIELSTGSTFDRVLAQMMPPAPDEKSIASVYDAYQSGLMSPSERADFEADVGLGKIMLPRGATLSSQRPADSAQPILLPQSVTDAYVSGAIQGQARKELEDDIRNGIVQLPSSLSDKINAGTMQTGTNQQIIEQAPEPTLAQKVYGASEAATSTVGGMIGGIGFMAGQVEGIAKSIIDGTYGTQQGVTNTENLASQRAGQVASILPQPQTETGKQYAEAVGGASQNMQALGPLGAELGAISQGVRGAAGAIEARLGAVRSPVTAAADTMRRAESVSQDGASAATQAQAAAAGQSAVPIATGEQLAATARKASGEGLGSTKAATVLAEQAAPDVKVVGAAERLGISDYLQPDHVTTNQAYRELAQAVKSVPGSEARAAEMSGLAEVAKRADDIITEIGGTHDMSRLSSSVKGELQSSIDGLEQKANALYSELRSTIPAKAEAPASSVLAFIGQRADELGGIKNLSPAERMIQSKLSPKDGVQPTYALLDDVRRDLTAARIKAAGPFKDADTGLLKKLESELKKDQGAVVEQYGASEKFAAAQKAVAVRKGIEDDLVALFGKASDGSIVGKLESAVKVLPKGDTSGFIKLIKAVPESMRQDVVASGLATAFGKNAKNHDISFGAYADWYDGLVQNKQAYHAIMSNLPSSARKQLSDLYRVSDSVRKASKERITTGRITAISDQLKDAEGVIGRLYSFAQRASVGLAAEAVTTSVGMPGAGVAAGIASALTKGKTSAMKAADTLIASPEFVAAVKDMARGDKQAAAARLASSKAFGSFFAAIHKANTNIKKSDVIADAVNGEKSGKVK